MNHTKAVNCTALRRQVVASAAPLLWGLAFTACGPPQRDPVAFEPTGGSGEGASSGGDSDGGESGSASTGSTRGNTGDSSGGGDGDDPRLDVGEGASGGSGEGGEGGPPRDLCRVGDDDNAGGVRECEDKAPPNAFEADIQWSWTSAEGNAVVIPLVANMTDDDGNGSIDLCDTPDVLVVSVGAIPIGAGSVYVLDGETGAEHTRFSTQVEASTTPAVGDIDGDGVVEVVAHQPSGLGGGAGLVAFEHDGTVKWTSGPDGMQSVGAIALADLDADGDVEIISGTTVFDHEGTTVFTAPLGPLTQEGTLPTAADLDRDGDLEVIWGALATHHDGTLYFDLRGQVPSPAFPQVADLDGDPDPEVLLTSGIGLTLLDHDGAVKYTGQRPTGDPSSNYLTWLKPATVHDLDGDGVSEFATGSANNFTVYERDASVMWRAPVFDQTGSAAATAFDFLGDGEAEAIYADEGSLYVYDGGGNPVLTQRRSSRTAFEYPVVVDVDNDGSAEILVVSDNGPDPTLIVLRDLMDRWIQPRRIWNQHTYHVTNVREDGTIPQVEPRHWERLNTFRTNAQIEGGGICLPPPPG